MLIRIFAFVLFLFFPLIILSQSYSISGIVTDESSKEPLPFVSVVITGEKEGVVADIDGKFTLSSMKPIKSLSFAYVGYHTLLIHLDNFSKTITAEMTRSVIDLKEIVVIAGENPAHRIIKSVVQNRNANDPMQLQSFSYESYNKFIYSMDPDSLRKLKAKRPFTEFVEKNYLFICESFSKRKFMKPDRNKEVVMATKVSGVKDPSFALLATEFQSFSFYEEIIRVYEKNYINPISKGSTDRYLFLLEDTLFDENKDTTFIISFQPKKNRNFEALKGLLYINSRGYAIQNVLAEPFDSKQLNGTAKMDIKIQQKYALIEGRWFPEQLNADMIFGLMQEGERIQLFGTSRSYLKNIKINPALNKKDFDNFLVEYTEDASQQADSFWVKYRTDTLNKKERNTYQVVDSIGKKYKLDEKLKLLEVLIDGKIPAWKFNLDMDKFLNYNNYEGFRLGAGAHTSSSLSKYFIIGGYLGYGFKDKTLKYGYDARIPIYPAKDLNIGYAYSFDVAESGGYSFYKEPKGLLSGEGLRNYLVEIMDKIRMKEADISFRLLYYSELKLFFRNYNIYSTDNYLFTGESNLLKNFTFSETGLKLRFAYGEKFIKTIRYKMAVASGYPVFWFNFSRGIKGPLQGEFNYIKTEAKVEKSFYVKAFGKTEFQLAGGYAQGELPYSNLYAAKAGYQDFGISMGPVFQTMRAGEFISDRFVSFCLSHNFEKLLYKGKKFQPTLSIVNNAIWGSLRNSHLHHNRSFNTLERGFYEAGLVINKIISSSFMGYGLGTYYRYGPYAYRSTIKNFAFTLSLTISL